MLYLHKDNPFIFNNMIFNEYQVSKLKEIYGFHDNKQIQNKSERQCKQW